MNEVMKKVLEVFKPPFKYRAMDQRIVDSEGNPALDIRGWGKFQYAEGGDKLQDAFGEYVADLINKDIRDKA